MNTRKLICLLALVESLDPMSIINSVLEQLLSQTQSSVETASGAQSSIDAEQLEASLEEMKAAQAEASKQKAEAMAQEAELSKQAKPLQEQTLMDSTNQLIMAMAELSASVLKLDQNMKGKTASSEPSSEQKDDIKLTIHIPNQNKAADESSDQKMATNSTAAAPATTTTTTAMNVSKAGDNETSDDIPVALLVYDAVDPTKSSVLEKRLVQDPSVNVNSGYSRKKADDYDVSLKEQVTRARKRAVLAGKRAELFEDLARTTVTAHEALEAPAPKRSSMG